MPTSRTRAWRRRRSGSCGAAGSACCASRGSPSASRSRRSAAASGGCGLSAAPWSPAWGRPEPCVEAVSLWVHLDPERWRPTPLSDEGNHDIRRRGGGTAGDRAPAPSAAARRQRRRHATGPSGRSTATSPTMSTTPRTGSRSRRNCSKDPIPSRSTPRSNTALPPSPARCESCATARVGGSSAATAKRSRRSSSRIANRSLSTRRRKTQRQRQIRDIHQSVESAVA